MSAINGTNVAAPIRPFDTNDSFPTAFANEVKGGHHTVDDEAARFAIPVMRREKGMLVTQRDTGKTYKLITDSQEATLKKEDFEEFGGASEAKNIKVTNTKTLDTVLDEMKKKWVIFILNGMSKAEPGSVEIHLPFKATVDSIRVSAPAEAILTTDGVEVQLEKWDETGEDWVKVDNSIALNDNTPNSIEVDLSKAAQPIVLEANTLLRCNVLKKQSSITNFEVSVGVIPVD